MYLIIIITVVALAIGVGKRIKYYQYIKLENEILKKFKFKNWNVISRYDANITVKSRQALEKYDDIKYFKENKNALEKAEKVIKQKSDIADMLKNFLKDNEYMTHKQYKKIVNCINNVLKDTGAFKIKVNYISSAGNNLGSKTISINQKSIKKFRQDPSLLMSKGEYSKYIKDLQKEELDKKQHEYYEYVNNIIDYANSNRDTLVVKKDQKQLGDLICQLFDRIIANIRKIKSADSEEWTLISDYMTRLKNQIEKIVSKNERILEYYESEQFSKIKKTCETLMNSQRDFNEYINEKVESISHYFGTRVVRNETINDDEYNYIRPYKKTITPFTAELSSTVFASAENNPMEYIVKYFYPDRDIYPEQIQKLYWLVEELETLKDAKQIIENYKAEYKQYLGDVPSFIIENDEAGFYSRLGFAIIDESVLTVEYRFSYTSGGGLAQRSFTVPMTEENIGQLISLLESKLTASAFAKEQRILMTKKLREHIKKRDNYTCCTCGNSTNAEPNLLLEIDHIIPIARGGKTVEENLQTLCWKCNRAKGIKIIN